MFSQLVNTFKYVFRTNHEYQIRVGTHFKHIYLLVIITEIRLNKLFVVWFTHIEHATEFTIYVFDDGYIRLQIEVDSRALDNRLQGRV